jgi:Ricin-type beta-trefoil lectin domain
MVVKRYAKAGALSELPPTSTFQNQYQTPVPGSAPGAAPKVSRYATAIIATLLSVAALQSHAGGTVDPVIDIHSTADVNAKRAALVQYIWGTSWSNVLSKQPIAHDHYTPVPDDALPPVSSFSNLDRIEQIVTTMCVPALNGNQQLCHTSASYLFHPRTPNGRVIIVHHGHGCVLDGSDGNPYNLDKTIQALVSASYAVIALRMPLYQSRSQCYHDQTSQSHDEMFSNAQRLRIGTPLQFFLEPVARALNYIQAKYSSTYHDYNMIGLSGGGWTTTVYAAIDPRIVLSFPVAGSLPLDLSDSTRDSEQRDTGFYNIAGYRDLYLLGSFGSHRRQTQILNVRDNCCFKPNPGDAAAYTCQVQTALSELGSGAFLFDYDETSVSHQISLEALSGVILPTLDLGSPAPAPGSCAFVSASSPLVLAGRGVTTNQANQIVLWKSSDGIGWSQPISVRYHTAHNTTDQLALTTAPPSVSYDGGQYNLLWMEPNGDVRFATSHDASHWLAEEQALTRLPPSSAPSFSQGNGTFLALLYSGGDAVTIDLNNSASRATLLQHALNASVTFGNHKFLAAAVGADKSVYAFDSPDGSSWNQTGTVLNSDLTARGRETHTAFAEGHFFVAVETAIPYSGDIPAVRCTYLESSDGHSWTQDATGPCSNAATGFLLTRFRARDLAFLNFNNSVTSVSADFGPWQDIRGVYFNGQFDVAGSSPTQPAGSLLYIVNQHSDKCLDVAGASTADQAKVQQYECHEGGNQRWMLVPHQEIINQQSGKCLDVAGGSLADQTPVQQFHCHGGPDQHWRVTQRGEIVNQNSGKCLDLPNGGTTDQIGLQQFGCHQGSNQRWLFP